MFKSLYSGVSGLGANLTNLDVIGNNIANSNTVGFKSGRVTFNEMLTQTMKSASRPVSGGLGGTNPQQIGLGTKVGSIDTNFNQGNFQTTGKKTDLAIQGPGFFVLSDGTSRVYTRAGVFGLDSENQMVNPTTGLRVQGLMADATGNIIAGPLDDIFIDPALVVPAQPSTNVRLMGNLDSASDAQGTVQRSTSFLAAAAGADLLTTLSRANGTGMGLSVGKEVVVSGLTGGAPIAAAAVTVTAGMTYQDLVTALNAALAADGQQLTLAIGADGSLSAANAGATDAEGLAINIGTGGSLFAFAGTIAGGASGTSDRALSYADETDLLVDLYGADGSTLNLNVSGGPVDLVVGGSVGGDTAAGRTVPVDGTTTLADLMQEIQYGLGVTSTPVELDAQGRIVVRGEVGTANAIGDISISQSGALNGDLEGAFDFTPTQEAKDQKTFSMSTTVYDSLGGEHTVSFTFEKVPGLNEWIWSANMEGGEDILGGDSGRARFSESGAISSFTFDDGSSGLSFQPQATGQEGASNVTLAINYGDIGALNGLTQFEGTGTLKSVADGYGTGTLVDFNIDQSGLITGVFSNDTSQAIAQIALATFSNADGLTREANNTYRRSGNSGEAIEIFAGGGNGVSLVTGALETSNVDLAREFTNLVVAQRAFQANSRVVTTADQVMQELVNLVR
ncbi:MAG: flagellar hook-basal body complex protein [bacterium]|nr:flagellar hook-basal body complex protein [bacterium]